MISEGIVTAIRGCSPFGGSVAMAGTIWHLDEKLKNETNPVSYWKQAGQRSCSRSEAPTAEFPKSIKCDSLDDLGMPE